MRNIPASSLTDESDFGHQISKHFAPKCNGFLDRCTTHERST